MMQWLIDICVERILDEIGIPPTYIDRGDPPAQDYDPFDLTLDGGWHTLDLSAIVPAGAILVALRVGYVASAIGKVVVFNVNGSAHHINTQALRNQVAGVWMETVMPVTLDADRKVEYLFSATTITNYFVTVKGWWL